jgi:hypothetical protein
MFNGVREPTRPAGEATVGPGFGTFLSLFHSYLGTTLIYATLREAVLNRSKFIDF